MSTDRARPSTYDAIPYTSVAYPRTHPDHLHAMARLFAVRTRDVETCRVLEIGCGAAVNLIAMAAGLPRATFVGVDPSEGEIARGRALSSSAALDNVSLVVGDASSIVERGPFDFVITHGVVSWVAPDVRRGILATIAALLHEHGVAYVSYNVNPGWHLRGAVRSILRHHTRSHAPQAQVDAARTMLSWLSQRVARDAGPWRAVLDDEIHRLAGADDTYLFHEHLEPDNHPLWFHELAAEASAAGLSFLCEAEPAATLRKRAAPRAHASFAEIAGSDDPIAIEQYFDFVRGRSFRASVFVRSGHVRREAEGRDLTDLVAASPGTDLTIGTPDVEHALAVLSAAWPDGVPLTELDPADPATLIDHLAPLHAIGVVELRARQLGLAREGVSHPQATRLARVEAAGTGAVTNLRHEPIPLLDEARAVLQLLDGRDVAAVRAAHGRTIDEPLETLLRAAFVRPGV